MSQDKLNELLHITVSEAPGFITIPVVEKLSRKIILMDFNIRLIMNFKNDEIRVRYNGRTCKCKLKQLRVEMARVIAVAQERLVNDDE